MKIPATAEGVPAIQAMTAEGRSINVTLIFSLSRYAEVIEAYLAGLEDYARGGGDLAAVHSVASFFVSRVDTEVDRRLDAIGTDRTRSHCAARRRSRRPSSPTSCSASTSPANGGTELADTRRATCNDRCGPRRRPRTPPTRTRSTSTASSAPTPSTPCPKPPSPRSRTTARWPAPSTSTSTTQAATVLDGLADVGVDMDDVGLTLEDQGVAGFHQSFAHVLDTLDAKARQLAATLTDGLGRVGAVRPRRHHRARPR